MIDAPVAADDTTLGTGTSTADRDRGKQNSHWTVPRETNNFPRLALLGF